MVSDSLRSLTEFTPSHCPRLHHFVWHGTDRNHKTQKLPGRLQFEKLRVIPDQFYYNIDDVSPSPSP